MAEENNGTSWRQSFSYDQYGNRNFDPFLASGSLSNPQTWNRYAYSLNDRLNLTDETGLSPGGASDEYFMLGTSSDHPEKHR